MSINRLTYVIVLILLALCGYVYVAVNRPPTARTPQYVGVERCRVCHAATDIGAQFRVWEQSAHANAGKTLESEAARYILAQRGKERSECRVCHVVGNPVEPTIMGRQPGVSCEACHGPGSLYSDYHIMADSGTFGALGGVRGSLADCASCHKSGSARDSVPCPGGTRTFVVDSAWKTIAHPVPEDYQPRPTVIQSTP